jgi:predicted ATP-grasp superfamily ATP-dependent carboligase
MQLIQGLNSLLLRQTENEKLREKISKMREEISELSENIFKACDMDEVGTNLIIVFFPLLPNHDLSR